MYVRVILKNFADIRSTLKHFHVESLDKMNLVEFGLMILRHHS